MIGIDFGTCNSSAALFINDNLRVVKEPTKQGYSVPSSIYVTETGEILVGHIAENKKIEDITRYRREFKRDLLQNTPYLLGRQGEYQLTPKQLVTEVIKTLKKEADRITTSLGKEAITEAVITIPATYIAKKKDLMKEAAQQARFTTVQLLEEPVAAAIYYNYQNSSTFKEGDIILVYDLGGGTFDATLIKKQGNGFQILGQPLGKDPCGGIDFDREIFRNLQEQLNGQIDPLGKILIADFCRNIKHQLSSTPDATGVIPINAQRYRLTSVDFDRMIDSYVEQTLLICEDLIKGVGLGGKDITQVLMVGGSCRIPYIQKSIESRLQTSVLLIDEPELAVCQGSAIYGSNLSKSALLAQTDKMKKKYTSINNANKDPFKNFP